MAVTPTFPSRDSLRRLRFRPLDAVVGAGVFLLIYAAVRVGATAHVPIQAGRVSTIDTSPSRLPYYAARSLLRMFVALFFAYTFSLGYAYVAARNRRARRVMIPALDILQSVPILGFLAVTVTFFLALFPGSELGLEAASVFAVFTSQAWNITFSFYHSLVTQSGELDEASRLMGLSRWKRFWSIDVPGGAIGLVWNGMMSFGGSWFFLTASELIIVGGHRYTLPGVGSYVGVAVEQGELGHVVWGIVTMIVMILAVNVVFWRPLVAYAAFWGGRRGRGVVGDLGAGGRWIGFNPRVAQYLQPVVQVLARFPANFIFPFAIVLFLDIGLSLNYGSILLMALGTQWYILFNVIAGASAVPRPAAGRHQPRHHDGVPDVRAAPLAHGAAER